LALARSHVLPAAEDKSARVQAMFDQIAPRYDLLNRVLTFGLDQRWRRATLDAARIRSGDRVLDLACGTGDLVDGARARGARVIGADFSREMLRGARTRETGASFVQADAQDLPLPDATMRVVTCGFALRNFASLDVALREMARVLAPGGRIALLEVDRPNAPIIRAGHSLYFDRIVPWIGGLISDRDAYRYLPESTVYLPPGAELAKRLAEAGFDEVERRPLLLGAAQILTGTRR